ncbi:MAG: hypothetical protein LBL33_09195 [Tannerella sp.]|jgi:hypothetical protein|nr:hypothetical protein [Tannerella sp.]
MSLEEQQMTSDHRSRPVWDGILVEPVRLIPCTRPVRDGMWVFGNTFRP